MTYHARYWQARLILAGLLLSIMVPYAGAEDQPAALAQEAAPAAVEPVELETTYPFFQNSAIAKAVGFLKSRQQPSGGIDSFGFGADPGGTARVLYAINAIGYPANTFTTVLGVSGLDFLRTQIVSYTYASATPATENLFPARAGLVLAGIAAAEANPNSFGGVNLIAELNAVLRPTGAYSTTAAEGFATGAANDINQTLAIFGLVAAGQPIPVSATDFLLAQQNPQGSWSNSVDVTGYAVMALIGSGNVEPSSASIQRALAFLRASQTERSALWGDEGEGEPANSTGWAMTALSTAGYTPMTESWATGGTTPRAALLRLQDAEGVIAAKFFNAYATLEGLYGLTDQPLFLARPLRVARALAYLSARQNADGGWPGFGTASSAGETIDNLLAIAAAGVDPVSVAGDGKSALDFLRGAAADFTRDTNGAIFPAQTGKLIVGVVASGANPASFAITTGSLNLVGDLVSTLQPTGAYSSTASRGFASGAASPTTQAFALLGLAAAGQSIPAEALAFLKSLQAGNGSWGSVDETGLALQALLAAGLAPSDPAVVAGITYLRDSQAATGGWEAFGDISVNSTAYAIQGLLAAGVDLTSAPWLKNGRSPLGVLASYQKPDGPFVVNWNYAAISPSFNPTADNLYATQQALPALLGRFYPYRDLGSFVAFSALKRGPDPDRTVTAPLSSTLSADRQQLLLTIPYGSDLNATASLTVEWQLAGIAQSAAFTPAPTLRSPGFYTATIPVSGAVTPLTTLDLRVTLSDPDGVQDGATISSTVVLIDQVGPRRTFLSLVGR